MTLAQDGKKKEPFQAILQDLNSENDQKISSAINKLRNKGNEKTVRALIDLLLEEQSPEIEDEIVNYLFDLKNESAIQPIIDAISDPGSQAYKATLISVFWQSALDASDHLNFLVDQAVFSDNYMITLEALTVIENLKGPFSEEELIDCISLLNEHVEEESDERKRNLMINLIEILNQL